MALHPKFPKSPYEVLEPEYRWFPADEALRTQGYEKLLPPLVAELRKAVKKWRDENYEGASETSKALLTWWFKTEHVITQPDGTQSQFRYYYAQREAVETIIYLHDIVKVNDKYDLMRFDASGVVSASMFPESWRRFVVKMATGSGKTKVLSLLIAWSYFHRLYEDDSNLARNFLLIAPNIIVLDRLRTDFDGLRIFYNDPVVPEDGYQDQNWKSDFNLSLHIQDEVHVTQKTGNIFLTNIHRVYESADVIPTFGDENTTDYFLGTKPVGATNESKVDLSAIVRDVDELIVLNDEAHHVHDEKMAWFKSIEDIHNKLKMKGSELSLQIDVTATPKHNNGAIFVQTVSDYPLVEAIHQDVVKHPVLPDSASRAKLQERQSSKFTERYADYLHLGYLEWKKVYEEHKKLKKAVLFVMTDDTKNCDEVSEYLQLTYPELKDAVLTIHTKDNGEISESASGKSKEELEKLRKESNEIDTWESPYKVIVSVLMLKEGWDVRNVTTIVGLRAYSSRANILPEQTLGRGLRRMYRGEDLEEFVSVVGTDAFMDFVESIKSEGVELERKPMGGDSAPKAPIVVEIDRENLAKDIEKLDIEIPVLSPRIYREYKNLSELNPSRFGNKKLSIKEYSEEEKREIVFKPIVQGEGLAGETHHVTVLDHDTVIDYQSVIGYFCRQIMRELRLVSGYDVLYEKVKEFIKRDLFDQPINLEDLNVLRNLSEVEAARTVSEMFKKAINSLTVLDRGEAEIREYIKISKARPFVAKDQGYIIPQKSIFNKVIGDSHLELEVASLLERCPDVISYTKNYYSVHFKIDYRNAEGAISDYYPDFLVKLSAKEVYIVETKGREDLDDVLKIERLKQWCEDVNKRQSKVHYSMLYVKQEQYEKFKPQTFMDLVEACK